MLDAIVEVLPSSEMQLINTINSKELKTVILLDFTIILTETMTFSKRLKPFSVTKKHYLTKHAHCRLNIDPNSWPEKITNPIISTTNNLHVAQTVACRCIFLFFSALCASCSLLGLYASCPSTAWLARYINYGGGGGVRVPFFNMLY